MSGPYGGLARLLDRGMAKRVQEATMDRTNRKKSDTARTVKVYAPFSGYNRAARRKLLRGSSLGTLKVPEVARAPSKMDQWLAPCLEESLGGPDGEGT